MTSVDVYRKLARRLKHFPMGVPETNELYKILKFRFMPEEAEIASNMTMNAESAETIAERCGRDVEDTSRLLEKMAKKGNIFRLRRFGAPLYGHILLFGVNIQVPFHAAGASGKNDPELQRLAKLWDEYWLKGLGNEMLGSKTPFMKVLPVEKEIPIHYEVVPHQKVSEVFKNAKCLYLLDCACRVAWHRCDKPIENCFIFGSFGDWLFESGRARRVSLNKALKIMEENEKVGLVAMTDNSQNPIFVCNCCGCCCHFLRGLNELDRPNSIASSGFLSSIDLDICNGCGECEAICQIKAVKVIDGVAKVDDGRCLGCGLCVARCPVDAMSLIPSERAEPPRNVGELVAVIAKEKGRKFR